MSAPSLPAPDIAGLIGFGFLYTTNPYSDAVSGNVLLGSAHLGSSVLGNSAFGSMRTADPIGPSGAPPVQPWAEAAALAQTGGIGTHASQ